MQIPEQKLNMADSGVGACWWGGGDGLSIEKRADKGGKGKVEYKLDIY